MWLQAQTHSDHSINMAAMSAARFSPTPVFVFPGFRDLYRYTCPQEHHSVQSGCEAGPERRSSVMGGCIHWRVRLDVPHRHRHRHQCDGGSAGSRNTNPGHPGGARRRDIRLHHLSGDPSTRAQLPWEAAPQGDLHPVRLQHHGRSDISGLRLRPDVSVRMDSDTLCQWLLYWRTNCLLAPLAQVKGNVASGWKI